MPTPSELQSRHARRSVFGNYIPAADPSGPPERPQESTERPDPAACQAAIDKAVARAFLYRFLAKAFESPDPQGWAWISAADTLGAVHSAWNAVNPGAGLGLGEGAAQPVSSGSQALAALLKADSFDEFAATYLVCFGHTVRGECPMNETEYGDIKADPLFQPHRLADLGAFFGAFGLELTPDAAERIDHVSIELEFMSVLAAKEAYALEHGQGGLEVLADAQRQFLREHLGRWSPAFARRLSRFAGSSALGALARCLGQFIQIECARFKIPPGSQDLLLRPVDDTTERLCDTCGIHGLPPGAVASGATV